MNRDANSQAIFIPREFGESGNGNLSFIRDRRNLNLLPGFRVRVRGISGSIEVNLKFLFIEKIFF